MRLKSDQAGSGEVFYFRDHAEPGKSVQFSVPAGRWTEARVPMPALGANHRLRLDPPGTGGKVLLANLRFEKRVKVPLPSWPAWTSPELGTQRVLANGFTRAPAVKVNGAVATNEFHTAEGRLVLKLVGDSRVELEW